MERLLERAKYIAIKAHEGQFRRNGVTPYIEHCKAVASRSPKDEESQAVAWLHNTLEDTQTTFGYLIDNKISYSVAWAVNTLTKSESLSYEQNLKRVANCKLAIRVKIADMLSNLADDPTDKQIKKYSKGLLFLLKNID